MKIEGKKILFATTNKGKIAELEKMLAPYGVTVLSGKDISIPEIKETGMTFAENAVLKAEGAAKVSGILTLADDSGLEVAALGGKPGVYSARFVVDGDYVRAMDTLYHEAENKGDLTANFTCVLALAAPGKETRIFTGKVFGQLVWPPMGENGFGYDPFFVPDGYKDSFGVLDAEIKNKISHRAKALQNFINDCL